MLILLAGLMMSEPMTRQTMLRKTWEAITIVESGGESRAIGDGGKSWGIAQIGMKCLRDCNRIIGYPKWKSQDRLDPVKSFAMFSLYVRFYFPCGTPEQFARCWNGGPTGPSRKSTESYWVKIQAQMERAKK